MSLRSSKLTASPENLRSDLDDNLSVLSEDELEERDHEETLPCAECGKDLTTESSSTGCDFKFCNRWFHPSCLPSDVPFDRKWFCHLCEDDRPPDPPNAEDLIVEASQKTDKVEKATHSIVKCVKCKRKVNKCEYIACKGKCGKEFHGDCFLSDRGGGTSSNLGGPLLNFHLQSSLGGASRHLARTRSQVHFGLAI